MQWDDRADTNCPSRVDIQYRVTESHEEGEENAYDHEPIVGRGQQGALRKDRI